MPRKSPTERRRPIDLSHRDSLNIQRTHADRSKEEHQEEKRETPPLPFDWPPSTHNETAVIQEEAVAYLEIPIHISTRTIEVGIHRLRNFDAEELPNRWKPIEGTPLEIYDPLNTTILTDIHTIEDGLTFAEQDNGTFIKFTSEPKTYLLKSPTVRNVARASFGPKGKMVAEMADGSLLVSSSTKPSIKITDPEQSTLERPYISQNGTIVAERSDGSLLLSKTNESRTVLQAPNEAWLTFPILMPDGTVVAVYDESQICIIEPNGTARKVINLEDIAIQNITPAGEDAIVIEREDHVIEIYTLSSKTAISLTNPLHNGLRTPTVGKDGTIIAMQGDASLVAYTPSGQTIVLRDPEGERLYRPKFTPDGGLIALRNETQLIRARARKSHLDSPQAPQQHPPRRQF